MARVPRQLALRESRHASRQFGAALSLVFLLFGGHCRAMNAAPDSAAALDQSRSSAASARRAAGRVRTISASVVEPLVT